MRYLNKFQYLSYRKVSLLYIVFILFYFLTGSVDALRHFKSLNEVVFSRIAADNVDLDKWKDSVSVDLSFEQDRDLLISSADPRYELSRYEDNITSNLNQYWSENTSNQIDEGSLRQTTSIQFQKNELPSETPNVVSSTLLGLETLRAKRSDEVGVFEGDKLSHEEMFGLVKLQMKSVFIQGESLEVNWPEGAENNLKVHLNSQLLKEVSKGEKYSYKLEQPGTYEFIFASDNDSLKNVVKVLSNNSYQFAFGQRYYHLNSGEEYVVSLHNQGFNSSNTSVTSSNDLVNVEWYQKEELKISSPNYFSGTVKLRFKAARADSLTLRLSSKAEFGLEFINSTGGTSKEYKNAIGVQLLSNDESLVVLQGKLVVFQNETTYTIDIDRGRFNSNQIQQLDNALGFMLEDALVVDKNNNRISFEKPVIEWLE